VWSMVIVTAAPANTCHACPCTQADRDKAVLLYHAQRVAPRLAALRATHRAHITIAIKSLYPYLLVWYVCDSRCMPCVLLPRRLQATAALSLANGRRRPLPFSLRPPPPMLPSAYPTADEERAAAWSRTNAIVILHAPLTGSMNDNDKAKLGAALQLHEQRRAAVQAASVAGTAVPGQTPLHHFDAYTMFVVAGTRKKSYIDQSNVVSSLRLTCMCCW
jgi:hypothetical protein